MLKYFTDRATDTIAVAGVTSTYWSDNGASLTDVATAVGILWLLIQIYLKLEERYCLNDEDKD